MTYTQQRLERIQRLASEQRVATYARLSRELDSKLSQAGFSHAAEYDDLLDQLQDYWTVMTADERVKATGG